MASGVRAYALTGDAVIGTVGQQMTLYGVNVQNSGAALGSAVIQVDSTSGAVIGRFATNSATANHTATVWFMPQGIKVEGAISVDLTGANAVIYAG